MSPLEYQLTLVAIILGLAIAHLLYTISEYIQHRSRVKCGWVPMTWIGILLVLQMQYWWELREIHDLGEKFSRYCGTLAYPTLMYLASTLIAPRVPDVGTLDVQQRYYANRFCFFGISALAMVTLIFHDSLVHGRPIKETLSNLTAGANEFRLAGLGLVVVLALCPWRFVHWILTAAGAGAVGLFLIKYT